MPQSASVTPTPLHPVTSREVRPTLATGVTTPRDFLSQLMQSVFPDSTAPAESSIVDPITTSAAGTAVDTSASAPPRDPPPPTDLIAATKSLTINVAAAVAVTEQAKGKPVPPTADRANGAIVQSGSAPAPVLPLPAPTPVPPASVPALPNVMAQAQPPNSIAVTTTPASTTASAMPAESELAPTTLLSPAKNPEPLHPTTDPVPANPTLTNANSPNTTGPKPAQNPGRDNSKQRTFTSQTPTPSPGTSVPTSRAAAILNASLPAAPADAPAPTTAPPTVSISAPSLPPTNAEAETVIAIDPRRLKVSVATSAAASAGTPSLLPTSQIDSTPLLTDPTPAATKASAVASLQTPLKTAELPTLSNPPAASISNAPMSAPAAQLAQEIVPALKATSANAREQPNSPHVLTIQLHPVELGRVEIRIERSGDGSAKIQLAAERPETLQRIVHDQSQLHQALDQAGIPAAGRSLEFTLKTDAGSSSSFAASDNGAGSNAPSSGNGGSQRQQPAYPASAVQDSDTYDRSNVALPGIKSGVDITA